VAERAPFVDLLVRFAEALRAAGLAVGSGDVLTYCAALAPLDPTDLVDLYWAGRTTLVIRRDDIPVYDRVFGAFYLAEREPSRESLTIRPRPGVETEAALNVPATEPGGERPGHQPLLGLMASTVDTLRTRSFAACTPEELAALRRIMARVRLTPPRRRSRRTTPARTGRAPDLRRTAREALRMHGEPVTLHWCKRRVRPRPLILILDVSGSMADYSRSLVQFAYSTRRAAAKVEVFCFGTRLTRVTTQLRTRNVDDALERAGKAVFDWEGGTRIGDCLDVFVRRWGRRGMARGGIVVICSDGLDRGDPDVLATAMHRLSLLCHRIVWMNPHPGDTVGMAVAGPHIDLLLSGRDLSGCEELARLLPTLG
jgi:uncharacterized protein with von Willebrand factor type A (vWA) domain